MHVDANITLHHSTPPPLPLAPTLQPTSSKTTQEYVALLEGHVDAASLPLREEEEGNYVMGEEEGGGEGRYDVRTYLCLGIGFGLDWVGLGESVGWVDPSKHLHSSFSHI